MKMDTHVEERIRDTTGNVAETALADSVSITCLKCNASFGENVVGCAPLLRLCHACNADLLLQLQTEDEGIYTF